MVSAANLRDYNRHQREEGGDGIWLWRDLNYLSLPQGKGHKRARKRREDEEMEHNGKEQGKIVSDWKRREGEQLERGRVRKGRFE